MSDLCDQDNMVKIRYKGQVGNHLVSSPLRKFGTYGMHTQDDEFCVHVDDQKSRPELFVLTSDEKAAAKAAKAKEAEKSSKDDTEVMKRATPAGTAVGSSVEVAEVDEADTDLSSQRTAKKGKE